MPSKYSLETVAGLLEQHRQRASYPALSALIGVRPQILIRGLPREPRHSWIVDARTGRPTKFPEDQIAPDLAQHPRILQTVTELVAWLDSIR